MWTARERMQRVTGRQREEAEVGWMAEKGGGWWRKRGGGASDLKQRADECDGLCRALGKERWWEVEGVVGGEGLRRVRRRVKGHRAREEDIRDHSDTPKVDLLVIRQDVGWVLRELEAAELLGRGVAEGAARGLRAARDDQLRRAEVGDLDAGVVLGSLQQEVLRLEVAMEDAKRVEVLEGGEDLGDLAGGELLAEELHRHDPLEELAALGQLEQQHMLLRVAQVPVQPHDIRVAQCLPNGELLGELCACPRRDAGERRHLCRHLLLCRIR